MYAATTAAVPGYCTSGSGVHTPAQWVTCAKLGWNQPTTGATHAGFVTGHSGAPVFLIGAVVIVLILMALSRAGRDAAPQRG